MSSLPDKRQKEAAESRFNVTAEVQPAAAPAPHTPTVGAMAQGASDSTYYPNTDWAQTTLASA